MKRTGFVFFMAWAAASGTAHGAESLGAFTDWTAFHDGTAKTKNCFVWSKPKTTAPANVNRGDVYVLVTHWPADKARNVFEVRAGYPYKDGSEVEMAVDGNKPFKLFTKDSTAWAPDAQTDNAIAEALRKGRSMTIVGTSSRGTKTTDTYSLSGFSAAMGAIDKECK